MGTWYGTITVKAKSPITFYKATIKNGTTTELGGALATFKFSNQITIKIATPVNSIQGSNGLYVQYVQTCSSIIGALTKAAKEEGINIDSDIKKLQSSKSYLCTDSMTLKQGPLQSTSVPSYMEKPATGTSPSNSRIDIISGYIKVDIRARIQIWDAPGNYVKYTIVTNSPIEITWADKNIETKYHNGYTYIHVTKNFAKEATTRLKEDFSKAVGHWILLGSGVKLVNKNGGTLEYSRAAEQSKANKASSVTTGEINAGTSEETGDVNLESNTADFTEGSKAVSLTTNSSLNDLMSNSMNGIFGIPYQWMSIADRRIDGSEFGRKYAEKIATRMPLLFLTPCRPAFLNGASRAQKNNIISQYFSNDKDVTSDLMATLLGDAEDSGVSRYYTANFAYAEYYRYVDVCCQTTAKLLNLGNLSNPIKINGKNVKNFVKYNWSKSLSSDFSDYFSSANAIPFYINANVTVNESINNDTMESSLAGTIKSKSEQAKELAFLLNSAGSATNNKGLGSQAINGVTNLIANEIPNAMANSSAANMITSINNAMGSIAAGGSMMFPELWGSSSMGRSYQIDIKLRSPDGDALSVYLNVLVPLYHLMCLAVPQMMNNNYNVYFSPFLVKGYCKSMFNIDMGIITGMDISKGREGDWNANGLPTAIDVSITLKDLYDVFCFTPYSDTTDLFDPAIVDLLGGGGSTAKKIVRNTAMMDYLCNNAGLNLNNNEVTRQITIYKMLRSNSINNWPNNKWLELQQFVDNKLSKVYSRATQNRK